MKKPMNNASTVPPIRSRIRFAVLCAVCAACLTLVFVLGAWAIPGISRELFSRGHFQLVADYSVLPLVEEERRLEEVRDFLDIEIAEGEFNPLFLALRGRTEALLEGPEAGFAYFVALFESRSLNEEPAPLLAFARVAGMAERWNDFFALCKICHDYGEDDALNRIFIDLNDDGHPIADALRTPAGEAYIAYAELDRKQSPPPFGPDEKKAEQTFHLWKLERDHRLDGKTKESVSAADLAQTLPHDLRAQYLAMIVGKTPGTPRPPNFPEPEKLLGPDDFTKDGKTAPNGEWLVAGTYSGTLGGNPQTSVWFVAKGEPLFHVYPLTLIELDGESQIHYLHFPKAFPERLRRRDGKPFSRIAVTYLNDFENLDVDQDRNIRFRGVYRDGAL